MMIVLIKNQLTDVPDAPIGAEAERWNSVLADEAARRGAKATTIEEAFAIGDAFLSNGIDPDLAEMIEAEAVGLALLSIKDRLRAQGLPTESNLTVHAEQLLKAKPALRDEARRIILARAKMKTSILTELGLNGGRLP